MASTKRADIKENRVAELFSWWSQAQGSDMLLAEILEVPRQTVHRWRTGLIKSLRPTDRREISHLLRINTETLNDFLRGKIELQCLLERRGERSLPLQELIREIEYRPRNELVAINYHLATLLTRAEETVSSQDLKKNSPSRDTLKRSSTSKATVIHLESFRECRRLRNLMEATIKRLGLNRQGYLQLVSGGDENLLEIARLFYADVQDETMRSHTRHTYQLFCPHLFRLVEWQGEAKDQPLIDSSRFYPDVETLLCDLKNSNQSVAVG